jgi:hypothetical protein
VTTLEVLPDDIAALRAALLAEREKRLEEAARAARIEAELAVAKAKASDDEALIAYQRLQIAKLTTPCSRSSARSMANAPNGAEPSGRN